MGWIDCLHEARIVHSSFLSFFGVMFPLDKCPSQRFKSSTSVGNKKWLDARQTTYYLEGGLQDPNNEGGLGWKLYISYPVMSQTAVGVKKRENDVVYMRCQSKRHFRGLNYEVEALNSEIWKWDISWTLIIFFLIRRLVKFRNSIWFAK